MNCDTERLSDYLDDELTSDARREIDAHLAACADCRGVLAELALVKETAAELADAERFPDTDLWPEVAHAIPVAPAAPIAGAFRPAPRRLSLSWTQALAASVALVTISSGAVWMAMRDRGVDADRQVAEAPDRGPDPTAAPIPVSLPDFADEAYDKAVKELRGALDEGRNRLDPQTIQVLERNLAAIDQAIDQARRALEADPANVSLTGYLASVKRRKLDLLRTASTLMQPSL